VLAKRLVGFLNASVLYHVLQAMPWFSSVTHSIVKCAFNYFLPLLVFATAKENIDVISNKRLIHNSDV
jgi:hypothetical protein